MYLLLIWELGTSDQVLGLSGYFGDIVIQDVSGCANMYV